MGGLFGTTGRTRCVDTLFYGVDYNSHLGTRRAGMACCDNGIFSRAIHNIENSYFRTKFECDLSQFDGNAGIGVISDTDAQPIIINCRLGRFAIVTVGRLNNVRELEHILMEKGHHFSEHSYDIINPTEIVATLISEGNSFADGIANVYRNVRGSCSMLILCDDGSIIAARDLLGRTPLIIGRRPGSDDYAVTSENHSFVNLGFETLRDVGPGEIVRIAPEGLTVLKQAEKRMQICSFLWIYYGYPPCSYEGRNVDSMRCALGCAMASRDTDLHADFVSAIPDSGIGMALGYSEGKQIPYRRGIVKYTPTWPRSFTPSTQARRELVAKMKLIPNRDLLKDKSVVFCDDSIVRGTQLRDNVADLLDAGATKAHIRISCPPLIYACRYINFTNSKSDMELITRRVIERLEGNADSNLHLYADHTTPQYARMVEEIRKELGLTSLKFNTIDDVVAAIGLDKSQICTHCFDGSSYEM